MEIYRQIIEVIILFLNIFSIVVLVWGILGAAKGFLINCFARQNKIESIRDVYMIKNSMGAYVLLSLEILIAADIIASILHPNLNDILRLAAVVAIRTVISHFLNKEVREADVLDFEAVKESREELDPKK